MKIKFLSVISLLTMAAFLPFTACAQGGGKETKNAEVSCPAGIDHGAWDRLLKKYVDARGLVNYAGWKSNAQDRKALDDYLKQFAAKAEQPAGGNEKAASLVNAYNAITITTILNAYPVESIHETDKPFERKAWRIGGATISLNDIEHGTLRPMLKYRAHSVLVCAARSCPPLQRFAYTAGSFEEQNGKAYRAWLGREELNKFMPRENKAQISEIFKWFKGDFQSSLNVPNVLQKYGPPAAKELTAAGGDKFEISYLSYNWGLNDQGEHGRHYNKINLLFDNIF
ncbi:MAG: DUF547 domain-containing protein [Chthoniobacterales bacterium]|nr:DUF547 domain-containing protein [Chthoniobacterales bacterium]